MLCIAHRGDLVECSSVSPGDSEKSKEQTNGGEQSVKDVKVESSLSTEYVLPPFDPSNPVGKMPVF